MKKGLLAIGLIVLSHALFAEGKVLNILVWNDEFRSRVETYAMDKLNAAGIRVNFITTPAQDGCYIRKLDECLRYQNDDMPADERIDLFLVEPDYAKRYVDSKYTLDIIKDIGLSEDDLLNQYEYTKDIGKDSRGRLKAVTWQVCPGGFCYRRSIAKAVLGTDDPVEVQKAISDWDSFDKVAAEAGAKRYYMVSGYDGTCRPMLAGKRQKLVNSSTGEVVVEETAERWIEQTNLYAKNGYSAKGNLWSADYFSTMHKDGKVFGYFGPAWFIDCCMAPNSLEDYGEYYIGNGSYGDYALCMGPQGFYWGGWWICAAAGTDNVATIRMLLKILTCDEEVMNKMALEYGDIVNNHVVMERLGNSNIKNAFLGNQNPMYWYDKIAMSLRVEYDTKYDQIYMECLQYAFEDYFEGKISKEKARSNFYNRFNDSSY